MFGYYPRQTYGPLNALADITNAYMQKKNMADAYAAAAGFSDDVDKQLQPKVSTDYSYDTNWPRYYGRCRKTVAADSSQ